MYTYTLGFKHVIDPRFAFTQVSSKDFPLLQPSEASASEDKASIMCHAHK